jgi:hypothetical protein
MKHFGLAALARTLADDRLNRQFAQFDEEYGTKLLEATGLVCKRVSVNPGSLAAGAEGSITATVSGVKVGDRVFASLEDDVTVGLYLRSVKVTAVNTLTFYYANHSAGTIDEAAHNVNVLVIPGDLN